MQSKFIFEPKKCEICGKIHTKGGTVCSKECADILVNKYLIIK